MQYHCMFTVRLHDMADDVKNLRDARVADTEERILAAAGRLFRQDGYAATTLAAVADAARVGHRTVYVRFGTKAALLKRVVDVAVAGDTQPIDVTSRDWFQAALTAPTLHERVDAYARAVSALMARAGDLIAIAQQAEPAEPLIAAAGRAARQATRDAVRLFCTRLRNDGLIPASSDVTWLADTAGLLSQAQTWLLGRDTLGWTSEQYSHWLATTLTRLTTAAGPRPEENDKSLRKKPATD
jgi:AcrR family transcriptional regulator